MFDKKKAKKYYEELVYDLKRMKKIYEKKEDYDGTYTGSIVLDIKKTSKKIVDYLQAFAEHDDYNFKEADVLNVSNGKRYKLYSIGNIKDEKIISLNKYKGL